MSEPQRISHAQLVQVAAGLSERDRAILTTVGQVRLASGEQLRRLHFPGRDPRAARFVLARLTHLGLLTRLDRRLGGTRAGSDGYLYQLDAAGQRLSTRAGTAPATPGRSPTPTATTC